MRTKIFTSLFLISFSVCYTQNLIEIRKKDTIYVFFKKKKNQQKAPSYVTYPPNGMIKPYMFNFPKNGYFFDFSFYSHYRDKTGELKEVPNSIIKKEKKVFFKKNKVLKYRDVKKMNENERSKLGSRLFRSTVYLIDKDEESKKKVSLRKVLTANTIPIIQ